MSLTARAVYERAPSPSLRYRRGVDDVAAIPPLHADDHVAGPRDAPLELVMYGDFQCPYCAAAQSIVRRVRERLDGRLRFAFRHMPLREVHPDAQRAAEAAEAAAAQDAFWPMHDRLYAARGRLGFADLVAHAAAAGLDAQRVREELTAGVHAPRVARDEQSAQRAGVTGTPAFFVNGVLHDGAFDAGSLVEALEAPRPRD
jgi:protein-disulfide isomerase